MSDEDRHRSEIAEDIQDLDTKLDFLEQSSLTGGLLDHPLLCCLVQHYRFCFRFSVFSTYSQLSILFVFDARVLWTLLCRIRHAWNVPAIFFSWISRDVLEMG